MDAPATSPTARLQASIMFADVSGFTAMSEKLDPEAVTEIMNRCFTALESIVIVRGGRVLKYIGDCVFAGFGIGDDAAGGAANAVQAAIDVRQAIASFNREAQADLPNPLEVHIGIASGIVIAGDIGGRVRREFSLTGDVVNLAVRLCDAAPRGDIAVSATTCELTRRTFQYREMSLITVKESAAPVAPYELRAAPQAERKAKFGSERRQATVLFADIIGFKALAQTMEADALTEILNHCFTLMENVVRAHGGIVDKFYGECVMALFGVPNAIEDAPKQALNAAIEIRNAVRDFNRDTPLRTPLDVRIGVNTGLVISGEIGGRVRRDFTVMGDAVNVASLLKDAAPEGGVYVGPETHRYTRNRFAYESLSPLMLKNKAQPVPAWALQSEHAAVHRSKVHAGPISATMVGRAEELVQVNEKVLELIEGKGGSVAVVGEAGLGKSRLLAEVLWLDAARETLVLEGRSLSIGQNLSFHPFVDLLRQWAGVREEDSDRDALDKLEHAVTAVAPEERDELVPFIATLMGLARRETTYERLRDIEGDALERLIVRSARDLFRHIAAARPVVLIFEDLHWADESSAKLIEALLRQARQMRILFIFLARPDAALAERVVEHARAALGPAHLELRLQPLSEQQSVALVRSLLDVDNLPFDLRVQITRVTEGNPYFIEEIVHALIDSGAIEEVGDRFRISDRIHSFVVPGTVQEVILSRVDRLDPSSRHLVQVAAVIGRSFYYSIIAEILRRQGLGGDGLDEELDKLKSRQLLLERKAAWAMPVRSPTIAAELEYVFKHALVQQTIYESMLQKTRKEFHLTVAEAIESLFRDRLAEFHGMLAYHYGRAEHLPKSEEYLFLAGEAAARSAASSEALAFFQEASSLYLRLHGEGGDPEKKALLEKNVGLALLNSGRLTESIGHFDVALKHLGEQLPQSSPRLYLRFAADVVSVLGDLYVRRGRPRRSTTARDHLVFDIIRNRARALTTSDPQRLFIDNIGAVRRINRSDRVSIDEAFEIYALGATLFAWSGISYPIARRLAASAAELLKPDQVGEVFLSRFLGFALDYLEGHWSVARAVEPELIERALRAGRFWDVQTYLGLACDYHLRRGAFAAARAELDRLAQIRDTYSYEFAGINHLGMSAILLLEERNLDEALVAANAYVEVVHDDPLRVLALGTRAKIEVLRGDREAAGDSLAELESTVRRARVIPPWHLTAYALARANYDIDALAHARRNGDEHAVRSLAGHAAEGIHLLLGLARKVALGRTEAYRLAARLAWLRGEKAEAQRWWQRTLNVGAELGAAPERARAELDIDECQHGRRVRDEDSASRSDPQARALVRASSLRSRRRVSR